jgi:uncharacterized protein YjbJ (UPF0337 family)
LIIPGNHEWATTVFSCRQARFTPPFAILTMNNQLRTLRQVAATCLGMAFSFLVLFTVPLLSSPAQASSAFTFSTSALPLAVTAGRAKADAKAFEGKTQESIGDVTGNQGDRLAGKAKQAEANVRNAVEDAKDKAGMN